MLGVPQGLRPPEKLGKFKQTIDLMLSSREQHYHVLSKEYLDKRDH